jgi:hypothetical protein
MSEMIVVIIFRIFYFLLIVGIAAHLLKFGWLFKIATPCCECKLYDFCYSIFVAIVVVAMLGVDVIYMRTIT